MCSSAGRYSALGRAAPCRPARAWGAWARGSLFPSHSQTLETNGYLKNYPKSLCRGTWPPQVLSQNTLALPLWLNEDSLVAVPTACFVKIVAAGEIKPPRLSQTPTGTATELTLPVYEGRPRRLRSTRMGVFVSEEPISSPPL